MICPPSDVDDQNLCFPYDTKRRPADWWKTCVSCGMNQTQQDTLQGCAACLEEKKEHVRDPSNTHSCKTCASCEEVILDDTKQFDLADDLKFGVSRDLYYVQRVTASCQPLRRRRIEYNGVLQAAGDDYWRPPDKRAGQKLDPSHHAVDRSDNCKQKHCREFCLQVADFMFSDRCGTQIDARNVFVRLPAGAKRKLEELDVSEAQTDLEDLQVVTEGECKHCAFCAKGYHNAMCNTHAAYLVAKPQGECLPCKIECALGDFMLHPVKDAGCHDPPKQQMASDGSEGWMIASDYVCEKCPKWVKNGDKLLAVRACGKISTYSHFSDSTDKNDQYESTSKSVDPMPDGDTPYPGGTAARKNFRTFLDNAAPYCPFGFFFNSKLPACDFMDQGRELTLPGSQRVLVGDDPYNSKCCEVCKNCESPLAMRDTANWKPCIGDSVMDVQNFCMAKCTLGYWKKKDGAAEECHACSRCLDGIL